MGGPEVAHWTPVFYQTEHSLDRSTDSFGILKSAVGDLGYSLATYFLSNQAFLDSSTDMLNLEICISWQAKWCLRVPHCMAPCFQSYQALTALHRRFGILKSAFRDRRWEVEGLSSPPSPGILPPSHRSHLPSLPYILINISKVLEYRASFLDWPSTYKNICSFSSLAWTL